MSNQESLTNAFIDMLNKLNKAIDDDVTKYPAYQVKNGIRDRLKVMLAKRNPLESPFEQCDPHEDASLLASMVKINIQRKLDQDIIDNIVDVYSRMIYKIIMVSASDRYSREAILISLQVGSIEIEIT